MYPVLLGFYSDMMGVSDAAKIENHRTNGAREFHSILLRGRRYDIRCEGIIQRTQRCPCKHNYTVANVCPQIISQYHNIMVGRYSIIMACEI